MKDKMMHEQDRFLKEALRQVTPEKPGHDILQTVMTRLATENPYSAAARRTEPLIPFTGWFGSGLVITLLFAIVIFSGENSGTMTRYMFQMEEFVSRYMSLFVSRLFVLSSIACAVLFVVQVWLLTKKMKPAG